MNDKIIYDIFYATIVFLHESSLRAGVLFLKVWNRAWHTVGAQ